MWQRDFLTSAVWTPPFRYNASGRGINKKNPSLAEIEAGYRLEKDARNYF